MKMMMLTMITLAALPAMMVSGASSTLRNSLREQLTSLAICSSDLSTSIYDAVAPSLVDEFNKDWDSVATSANLDPLTDVSLPNVDIGCTYGGTEYCTAIVAECKKTWVQMNWGYMDGLGDLEISSYSLGDISTSADGCNANSAPSGASCIYQGNPTLVASLASGAEAVIQLNNVKVKANCDTIDGKKSYTVYDFETLTCTATEAEMNLETTICGSNCNIFSATVTKATMKKLGGITCKDTNFPGAVMTDVVNMLKSTIYKAIESTATKEINSEFSSLIGSGLPTDSCS